MSSSKAKVYHGEHGTYQIEIPCDDGTGGVLRITRAYDGDLHFSMNYDPTQPNADWDEEQLKEMEFGPSVYMCNVRMRSLIGGGSNSDLYLDFVKALNKLVANVKS